MAEVWYRDTGCMKHEEHEWRSELTSEQRVHSAFLGIDPGFVNHRKVESVVGQSGIDEINRMVTALPAAMPSYMREVQIDHIYTRVLIAFCSALNIKTLGELLSDGTGTLFSSIEQVGPCADVFEPNKRVISTIDKPGFELTAELHYTTSHVRSDTTKSELHSGDRLALIAQLHGASADRAVFYPLVIGAPWLYADDDVESRRV